MTHLDTSLTYYCENDANNFLCLFSGTLYNEREFKKCVVPLTIWHVKLVCLSFSAKLRTLGVNEQAIFLGGNTIKLIAIAKAIIQYKGP